MYHTEREEWYRGSSWIFNKGRVKGIFEKVNAEDIGGLNKHFWKDTKKQNHGQWHLKKFQDISLVSRYFTNISKSNCFLWAMIITDNGWTTKGHQCSSKHLTLSCCLQGTAEHTYADFAFVAHDFCRKAFLTPEHLYQALKFIEVKICKCSTELWFLK